MSDHEQDTGGTSGDDSTEEQPASPGETPADDPSEGPGPRGNEEIDPERLERQREDLGRTGN